LRRGSLCGRTNPSAGPRETPLHRLDDRNVPEQNGERVVSASLVEGQHESVVLRSSGPALNVPLLASMRGHESDAKSINLEYHPGSRRRHSIPTFTSHDEWHSGAGPSVLPDGRNPECTCAVNDRCLVRTQDGYRVVIASGVVLAQYALGDHMAESYAMVNLVGHGLRASLPPRLQSARRRSDQTKPRLRLWVTSVGWIVCNNSASPPIADLGADIDLRRNGP
jgi:hypothetical protein